MISSADDQLSETFSALADPTRRAILARLAIGDVSVGELASPFHISLPAVSRHLKVLERAGLIERKIEAQWRRCQLTPEPLAQASDWIEHYRGFWEARFDALESFLKTELSPGKGANHSSRKKGQKNDN
jgi:DNA-binding transcriptional ArsR family regulator